MALDTKQINSRFEQWVHRYKFIGADLTKFRNVEDTDYVYSSPLVQNMYMAFKEGAKQK